MKMTRAYRTALPYCLLFILVGCAQPGTNTPAAPATNAASPVAQRITSESVVKVAAQPVDLSAGGTAEASVRLMIQNGYHVNANPPTFPYLKATELEVSTGEGISLGFITYPNAIEKKFPFAEKALAVYEGETTVRAMLKADKTAKPGQRSLTARLRIQACDDQVCYAPGILPLVIPVNIK
jgi:DsbC/DsbD-like thiol-disulfide interchange protein